MLRPGVPLTGLEYQPRSLPNHTGLSNFPRARYPQNACGPPVDAREISPVAPEELTGLLRISHNDQRAGT